MAYDGSTWDETNPTNSTPANELDDIARDIKIGIRSRMGQEHIFPTSQTGTANAGPHSYITFQNQTGAPTLPIVNGVTQAGGIYFQTNQGYIEDSAGASFVFFASAAGLAISNVSTIGAIPVITGSGALVALAPASSGYILVSQGTTGTPVWRAGLGAITSGLLQNTVYTATNAGFVFAVPTVAGGGQSADFYKDTGSATTYLCSTPIRPAATNNAYTFMIPVHSGDKWKIIPTTSSTITSIIHEFWPL